MPRYSSKPQENPLRKTKQGFLMHI